jgi:hypothetical protein
MARCAVVGCEEKVIGGFQETLSAGSFQRPAAGIKGGKIGWCATHQSLLLSKTLGKSGVRLTVKELGNQ